MGWNHQLGTPRKTKKNVAWKSMLGFDAVFPIKNSSDFLGEDSCSFSGEKTPHWGSGMKN